MLVSYLATRASSPGKNGFIFDLAIRVRRGNRDTLVCDLATRACKSGKQGFSL